MTTIDDFIKHAPVPTYSRSFNLADIKQIVVTGGIGIVSALGIYSLVRYMRKSPAPDLNVDIQDGYTSQVTMISQYMDSLGTSGMKLAKKGKPLVNYGNTCFLNSALQVSVNDCRGCPVFHT